MGFEGAKAIFLRFNKVVCLALLLLSACTNPPYRGTDVYGADEFVLDSYSIRKGKFSILELQGKSETSLSPDWLEEYRDTINEGDSLQIAVFHPNRPDLVESVNRISQQIGFIVMEDKITLPDLGSVEIANLTLEEARKKIEQLYLDESLSVEVFLRYKERLQRKVELAGLVQISSIPVDGRIRLFEALSLAKVPPSANLFRSYLVRSGDLLPVDMYKLLKEGDMSQNVVLKSGDKIYIAEPSATTIMVLGEVGKERLVDLPNGFMSLRQAIAEAGGIAPTGDRSYIQVIRGSLIQPKIYTLNWQHIVNLPSDSLLLMPGDIVYVAATPISEWNRFVSQLLPTFIGIDLISKGIKGIGINIE